MIKRDSSFVNNEGDNLENDMGQFDAANLQPIYDKDQQLKFCQKFKDNIYS